jgi:serine/threonine protein phosphatase PrpC
MTNDRINTKEGDGSLGVARSFGDYKYKGFDKKQTEMAVSCEPDVTIYERKEGDKFVFLACDGIWDVKSNQ